MCKWDNILLILATLLLPAWCLAGVNVDWYDSSAVTTSYLFSWDAETVTANIDSGNSAVDGIPNNSVELSTDNAVSGQNSVKISGGYDSYAFNGQSLFNPVSGEITTYVFGNYDDFSGTVRAVSVYSSGTDSLQILQFTTNRIQAYFLLTSGSVYATSDDNSMLTGEWNKCVFHYDTTSGSTEWTWTINGVAAGSGSSSNVWDAASVVTYIRVGSTTSVVPTVPMYIDDVLIK